MKDSQIKSKKRVKELGEVYTNKREVNSMLAIIPQEIWSNSYSKFLEPACGNGNFIEEIIRKKFSYIKNDDEFLFLVALANVYGVDINAENVIETQVRVKDLVNELLPTQTDSFKRISTEIIKECYITGNTLVGDFKIVDWLIDVQEKSFQKSVHIFSELKNNNQQTSILGDKYFY